VTTPQEADDGDVADAPLAWVNAHPDLVSRLRADPPVRTAVLGCGAGADASALALAFPKLTLYGVDPDPAAVTVARERAKEHHLGDRAVFVAGDPTAIRLTGTFDLVVACHLGDVPPDARPDVLRQLAAMLGGEGSVLAAFATEDVHAEARAAGFAEVEQLDVTSAGIPVWRLRE
jgi:SAM-dependent methyltransferase